ncbi:MAG: J domain-containing protein, partial [Candidatus Gastranaerophilales bacterium]|nr:J domain-containing protein [Candidatus Gastranaerophilales bacterium]
MSENISGVKAIKLNGVNGDLKNESSKENDFIAEAMFQYVEDNPAAIGKNYFQKLLKKVNKDNILDIMEKYSDVSSKKSLISAIIKEIGSSDEDMTKALTGKGGVFTLLLERAKEAGIDKGTLKTYKKEFEKELKTQLGEDSFFGQARSLVYTNAENLDTIVNGLIQNIKNKELVTPEEKQKIESKSRKELAGEANDILSQKYEKAQKDLTAQLKYDGWAGDVADGFSKIWNNKFYGNEHGNTADLVREDLAKFNKNIEKLNRAAQLGTTTYAREFKKIFGVEFDPINIAAYKKAEATYLEALPAKNIEDAVNKELSLLLKDDKLNEEYKTQVASGGIPVTYVSASKEDVFNREYEKLTAMLGEENKALLDKKFISEKAETVDDKYKILHQVAKVFSESLAKNTKEKCKGESFDEIQKTYEASYKAAFGLENDIAKRVNDYNISQQSGAGAVKSAAVIAAMTAVSFATMGMGTPVVMGASVATAAGATAATEITDRFTSGTALDELKENGLAAYLEKGAEITDWGGVAKASATSAGMTILFMGQSYAVTNLCKAAGMSATAGAVTNSAAFIGTGLGAEYMMTGEISAQGATFTVLLAVVGGALQVIQIQKAEALNAAQQEAKLGSDIQSAREALGFDNDTPITADQLKAQYRKMAAQNHPDAGGSDIAMATINSAHDVLQNNMARIN